MRYLGNAAFVEIAGVWVRYVEGERKWIQQIADNHDKISIVTQVQRPLRPGIRACDPTREKVLIDLASLIELFEKTVQNVCRRDSLAHTA